MPPLYEDSTTPDRNDKQGVFLQGIYIEGYKCGNCDRLHPIQFYCECCGVDKPHNYIVIVMWCGTEKEQMFNIELN